MTVYDILDDVNKIKANIINTRSEGRKHLDTSTTGKQICYQLYKTNPK